MGWFYVASVHHFFIQKFTQHKTWEPLKVECYSSNGCDKWGVIWVKEEAVGSEDYEDNKDR